MNEPQSPARASSNSGRHSHPEDSLAPGFRLGVVQMRVDPGNAEANLVRAEARIAEAASAGAQVVLLPETIDAGWTHPSAATIAEAIPDGRTCQRLAKAAQAHSVHLCCGLSERDGERIFNSAVLISPAGEVIARHRKVNALSIEQACYQGGDRLMVAATELGTFGLMICADAFASDQVLSRSLAYLGADVILSPCAWAVPADHDHHAHSYGQVWLDAYQPVAQEFQVWIAAASNVGAITAGPWAGRACIGSSMVIGPDGGEQARAPFGAEAETILYSTIRPVPRPARGCGWSGDDGEGEA